jgi:hypothetical protein
MLSMSEKQHRIYPDYIPEACRSAIRLVGGQPDGRDNFVGQRFDYGQQVLLYSREFIAVSIKEKFDQLASVLVQNFEVPAEKALFFIDEKYHYKPSPDENLIVKPVSLLSDFRKNLDEKFQPSMDLVFNDIEMMRRAGPQSIEVRLEGKSYSDNDIETRHQDYMNVGIVPYVDPGTEGEIEGHIFRFKACDAWLHTGNGGKENDSAAFWHRRVACAKDKLLVHASYNS